MAGCDQQRVPKYESGRPSLEHGLWHRLRPKVPEKPGRGGPMICNSGSLVKSQRMKDSEPHEEIAEEQRRRGKEKARQRKGEDEKRKGEGKKRKGEGKTRTGDGEGSREKVRKRRREEVVEEGRRGKRKIKRRREKKERGEKGGGEKKKRGRGRVRRN